MELHPLFILYHLVICHEVKNIIPLNPSSLLRVEIGPVVGRSTSMGSSTTLGCSPSTFPLTCLMCLSNCFNYMANVSYFLFIPIVCVASFSFSFPFESTSYTNPHPCVSRCVFSLVVSIISSNAHI